MRTIFKVGITIAILFAIALAVYAASTYKDPLVYSNVKVTNISLQNWGNDFVYLDNGAVLSAMVIVMKNKPKKLPTFFCPNFR